MACIGFVSIVIARFHLADENTTAIHYHKAESFPFPGRGNIETLQLSQCSAVLIVQLLVIYKLKYIYRVSKMYGITQVFVVSHFLRTKIGIFFM